MRESEFILDTCESRYTHVYEIQIHSEKGDRLARESVYLRYM